LSQGGLILYRDARGPRRRDDGRRAVGAEGELVGSRAFAAG
jgi:hypothetical protein